MCNRLYQDFKLTQGNHFAEKGNLRLDYLFSLLVPSINHTPSCWDPLGPSVLYPQPTTMLLGLTFSPSPPLGKGGRNPLTTTTTNISASNEDSPPFTLLKDTLITALHY